MGILTVPKDARTNNGSIVALAAEPDRREATSDAMRFAPQRVHQRCVLEMVKLLDEFVESSHVGVAFTAPASGGSEDTITPDVAVVAHQAGVVSPFWRPSDRLLLAVEVVSPATARDDRLRKRVAYTGMGSIYWIVDLDAQLVERWLPCARRPDIIDDELFWFPEGASEPLLIDVERYFASVFRCFDRGAR